MKRWLWLLPVALLAPPLWAAFAPLELPSRDELFEIPPGTYARRMAGDKVEILPDRIDLTLGLNDVLLLRNRDEVPQQFGPVLIMPGQSFRLPFEVASTYSFACSAHASGQMAVVVAPKPASGWPALQWRWQQLMKRLNLDPAVGRVQGAGEAGRWQGAPTKWALAHEEKQRSQRPEAPDQWTRSAVHQSGERRDIANVLMPREFR